MEILHIYTYEIMMLQLVKKQKQTPMMIIERTKLSSSPWPHMPVR